jgi:glucosamine--fructose-6-phosphate aminotransferase (isomerizing)
VLLLLAILLARSQGLSADVEAELVQQIKLLPSLITEALKLDSHYASAANWLHTHTDTLFLGRGTEFPIALEGALKLKEISYIHAEGYPAGELKHGPLALVDDNMPVIVMIPNNDLLDKVKANIEVVQARGGKIIAIVDEAADFQLKVEAMIKIPAVPEILAPIIFTVPLQLLAYHTAVNKGINVDQPRNLAKSVTVE